MQCDEIIQPHARVARSFRSFGSADGWPAEGRPARGGPGPGVPTVTNHQYAGPLQAVMEACVVGLVINVATNVSP